MSKIRKLVIERLIDELEEIKETSTMKNANFDDFNEKPCTKFIKEKTRLWREMWITNQLKSVIEALKKEVKR